MRKKYTNLEQLVENEPVPMEDHETQELIEEFKHVRTDGWFSQEEFMKMCRWKSPRPKKHQKINSRGRIKEISTQVFLTEDEREKIEILTKLKGVAVPTASAILMLIDPQNYGVIDTRVWQVLYWYGTVDVNPKGRNLSSRNWEAYLSQLRQLAEKHHMTSREIERILFEYHRKNQEEKLY